MRKIEFVYSFFIALIIEDQYVIGAAGERGKSRAYAMGDDVISYVGGDVESIQIRGPTRSKMTIQVCMLMFT